jgi:predicted secreted protein
MHTATIRTKTLTLAVGDTLAVKLGEYPSTGFIWSVKKDDPEVLEQTGEDFEAAEATRYGGGGVRVFTFIARARGAALLCFTNKRPWLQHDLACEDISWRNEVGRPDRMRPVPACAR